MEGAEGEGSWEEGSHAELQLDLWFCSELMETLVGILTDALFKLG